MQRIAILGNAGAGKSTLAKKLSEKLNLPVHYLDVVFLRENWKNISKPEMAAAHEEIIKNDKWILDGNYSYLHARRFERADTIILLDFPTILCLWRVYKRTFNKGKRIDVPEGCENSVSFTFLTWILGFKRKAKRLTKEVLPEYELSKKVIILKNSREVKNFLQSIN